MRRERVVAAALRRMNTASPIMYAWYVSSAEPAQYITESFSGGKFLIDVSQPRTMSNIPMMPTKERRLCTKY